MLSQAGKSGRDADERFGSSVDAEGEHIVVGAPYATALKGTAPTARGQAVFFTRSASGWVRTATLPCAGWRYGERCGETVAISGNTGAAGAPFRTMVGNGVRGVIALFERDGAGKWAATDALPAPMPSRYTNDRFGEHLALDGNALLSSRQLASDRRDLVIFRRRAAGWTLTAVVPDPGTGESSFGGALDIAGDHVLVGARKDDGIGAAWLFRLTDAGVQQVSKLRPAAAKPGDSVGIAVALAENLAVLGGPGHDRLDPDSKPVNSTGAVWVLVPRGKCDGKGVCECKPGWSGTKCTHKVDVCKADALDCDDGNVCTKDSCDKTKGCVHAPDDTATCDDGDNCTGSSACKAGACVAGDIKTCPDDGKKCTVEYCRASDGTCRTRALSCGDGNPCTVDKCDDQLGCSLANAATGTACGSSGQCVDGGCLCAEGTMGSGAGCGPCACVHYPDGGARTKVVGKWLSPSPRETNRFGLYVALRGNLGFVTRDRYSGGTPIARYGHILERDATGTWTLSNAPSPSTDSDGRKYWGNDIALGKDRIVAGNYADKTAVVQGAVHVWDRGADGVWQQSKLQLGGKGTGTTQWAFGNPVTLDGEHVIAGARRWGEDPLRRAGAAFAWRRVDGKWQANGRLHCAHMDRDEECASALSADTGWLALGADDRELGGVDRAGSITMHRRTACIDINERKTGTQGTPTHNCSKHASCTNKPGTFECKCKPPAEGNGTKCKPWIKESFTSSTPKTWVVPAHLKKVEKVELYGGKGGKGGVTDYAGQGGGGGGYSGIFKPPSVSQATAIFVASGGGGGGGGGGYKGGIGSGAGYWAKGTGGGGGRAGSCKDLPGSNRGYADLHAYSGKVILEYWGPYE